MIILKTRSEVKFKVSVTSKRYATFRHPKMHPHTKFGISISKNIGGMHLIRSRTDGQTVRQCDYYEGCSNMNASSFITFFTYMPRQNGKRLYKGLYFTLKLAPALNKNTVYLSSYNPSNEGHVCILTNSTLRTHTSDIASV